MERREFLRKMTSDSAKVCGGAMLDGVKGAGVLGHQWMSAIERQLNELKDRSDSLMQNVDESIEELGLRMSEAVSLTSREFSRSLRQHELRLGGLERQQIITFLWLLTLSLVTGIDFVSSSMGLV